MQDHYKETWAEIKDGLGLTAKIVGFSIVTFVLIGFCMYLFFKIA